MSAAWKPARVGFSGGIGPYDAQISTHRRWNGFPIPRFDRATTEQMIKDMEAQNARFTDPVQINILRWADDGVTLEEVSYPGTEDEGIDTYSPDGDGMYHVGAYRWGWETFPEHDK